VALVVDWMCYPGMGNPRRGEGNPRQDSRCVRHDPQPSASQLGPVVPVLLPSDFILLLEHISSSFFLISLRSPSISIKYFPHVPFCLSLFTLIPTNKQTNKLRGP
jgi:hypothetical protein